MKLECARELKHRIRAAAADHQPGFATGISVSSTAGGFRVAIILGSAADERLLEAPALRRLLDRYRRDVAIEVASVCPAGAGPIGTSGDGVLRIGASIGHQRGGIGSLGFFARRRSDRRLGVVSCNHVIAMADRGSDGDPIVSPSSLDGGTTVVAKLDGRYPRLGAAAGTAADCAFATLVDGIAYDAASLAGGTLAPALPDVTTGLEVTAAGRATSGRVGLVDTIELDGVWMRYGMIRVAFNGVIRVGSATPERFAHFGDSGAAVCTTGTLQPVGLLFATSPAGGPHNAGWSWVHPVAQVTDALQVDLVTA